MATVQRIAEEFAGYFESFTREGSNHTVWKLKDGAPEELRDLVQYAHDDFMPDDWRYEFIQQAVSALAEESDVDEARNSMAEADIYTGDLLRWVGSNLNRPGYVDEAVDMFGYPGDFVQALQLGQSQEKDEVFSLVLRELEKIAEERGEEDTEDEE